MAAADSPPRPGLAGRIERMLPFWEPQLVVLVAIAIQFTLPDRLAAIRPHWVLPALEGVLLFGLVAASPQAGVRHPHLRRRFGLSLIAFVSLANIVSLGLLVHYLLRPAPKLPSGITNASVGHALILAGSGLWLTNVLLFGLWYWELDRGGPLARKLGEREQADFLFPQMADPRWAPKDWKPALLDYLYVSLTNACAFSPTDTMPLSQMSKWLMGTQALVSLVTVGLVVARAVNVLA